MEVKSEEVKENTPGDVRKTLESFFEDQDRSGWNNVNWDAEDLLAQSQLPWIDLKMPWEVPHKEILREARRIKNLMVGHRNEDYDVGYGHRGWKSICIHGISPNHTHCHTDYGYSDENEGMDVPFRWTEVADLCPVTTQFFKTVFSYTRYQRLRFMLLEPGGYILPHKDSDDHFLWAINIAISNPEGCRFRMKSFGDIPFQPGKAFKLDTSNVHSVWNNSNEDRFHIIVHGRKDDVVWDPIVKESVESMRRKF